MNRLLIVFLGLMVSIALVMPVSLQAKDDALSIGYIDLAKIFDQYEKTKDSDRDLEVEWQGKQSEIKTLREEITRFKDELELLSESAKVKKQEIIDSKIKELQGFTKEIQDELTSERNEIVRQILKDIDTIINKYGESNGYDLILNERVLLYRAEGLDLTDKIVKILNDKYKKEFSARRA